MDAREEDTSSKNFFDLKHLEQRAFGARRKSSHSAMLDDDTDDAVMNRVQNKGTNSPLYCCSCPHSLPHPHHHPDFLTSHHYVENEEGGATESNMNKKIGHHQSKGCIKGGNSERFLSWMRVMFVGVMVMSCVGVNWARPPAFPNSGRSSSSSSSGGSGRGGGGFGGAAPRLSEYEKHYRAMQSKAVKYLAQFGYLTGPSRETGNIMSADALSRAIKTLQAMGRVPQTGVIDRRTEELMSKPRCGNVDTLMGVIPGQGRSDLGQNSWPISEQGRARGRGQKRNRRYVEAPSKWDKKNLTFRLVNYTPDIKPLNRVREIIRDAFTLWSNATQLQFIEVMFGNADIMIQFASRYHQDGYPFDGKGMILAHAFFPGPGKGGDTHFDDDEFWTTNSTDGVDLFMVAAHEFGHALGLAHSAEPGALMYPWYQGFSGKFVLPRDDAMGIQKLYGPPPEDKDFRVALIDRDGNDYNVTDDSDDGSSASKGDDDQPPDPCTTPFDAISIIRSNAYIFIGKWFWRIDANREMTHDPVHIHKFWYTLPAGITKIDAVMERQKDKKILFFSGDHFWIFNANRMAAGFTEEGRPITDLGLPADVKRIDAVFTWGFNKRTYLVSGDMYWKLNENDTLVEYDYPRDMSIWRGVPVPLDAAFQFFDGKTYFFKGRRFYEFYDLRMRIDHHSPHLIANYWIKCSGAHTALRNKGKHNGAAATQNSSTTLFLFLLLLCCLEAKWFD